VVECWKNHLPVPFPVISVYQYDAIAEEDFQNGDHEILWEQACPVCKYLLNQL
jgi:hypothetical protein